VLKEAAAHAEVNLMRGVAENIILRQRPRMGTACFDLLLDAENRKLDIEIPMNIRAGMMGGGMFIGVSGSTSLDRGTAKTRMEQMSKLDSCKHVSTNLVRSLWPSARNYIGLRGGSDDCKKLQVDPYHFDESEDMEMEAYQPVLKKVKQKLNADTLSRSIIDDLLDSAVESAEESERQLKDVFSKIMDSYSSETVQTTQMQEVPIYVDENLDDIFHKVISNYGGPSEIVDSALEGVKMVQCISCHKTSCNFIDLWDQNHACQVNKTMICEKCDFEILGREQFIEHVDCFHVEEPIIFIK
jgi:hypothetical protein